MVTKKCQNEKIFIAYFSAYAGRIIDLPVSNMADSFNYLFFNAFLFRKFRRMEKSQLKIGLFTNFSIIAFVQSTGNFPYILKGFASIPFLAWFLLVINISL